MILKKTMLNVDVKSLICTSVGSTFCIVRLVDQDQRSNQISLIWRSS